MRQRRLSGTWKKVIESLETRRLLTSPQIDFANFASTAGLVTNGYGSSAITSSNNLVLTDGQLAEARSVLDSTAVPIDTFSGHFAFQITAGSVDGADETQEADGLAFVIDKGTTSDLGADGSDLGYAGGTFGAHSVAIGLNTYTDGTFGSEIGFTEGGQQFPSYVTPGSVGFHFGDVINANVSYNGTTLSITLTDTNSSHAATYTTSEAINLATVLGSHTAFLGFSGATGGDESIQTINEFDFTGTANPTAPTVTVAAASSQAVVTGKTADLTVSAVSNTGGTLSYAWSLLSSPAGATTPTFSVNNSAASATTATFTRAGTYRFRVTITDSSGGTAFSDVDVAVEHASTTLKIKPHAVQITKKTTKQFTAKVYDQFGHTFSAAPAVTYSIVTGSGKIDSTSGLYTAGAVAGHLLVEASADNLTGDAGATVV